MEKYRKAFYEIEKALGTDHGVIILFGLRKTGKTTILKQLSEKYKGHYIDFLRNLKTQKASNIKNQTQNL